MRIRPAVLEDYLQITKINKESLGYAISPQETKQNISAIISSPQAKLFVACEDTTETAIGYIHATDYLITYAPPLKLICSLAVAREYQGQGVGKKLLDTVEIWAKETGAKGLRLSSQIKREEAHLFYEHLGYTHTKTQKTFTKYFSQTI